MSVVGNARLEKIKEGLIYRQGPKGQRFKETLINSPKRHFAV
jgi:hypothetical protein